jgi:hypothetical protein
MQRETLFKVARAAVMIEDPDILNDSLWCLSYLADVKEDSEISEIAHDDVLQRVIECLQASDVSLFVPALRCIGNFMTTNESSIIERCLWMGVLDKLFQLLFTSSSQMIKECLWVISNITAGPAAHVDSVVKSDLFERICVLTESKNIEVRKEALFALCNGVTNGDVVVVGEMYQKT